MAAAKEISLEAAIVAVLSEVDGIFSLKEEQQSALKAFLSVHCFTFTLSDARLMLRTNKSDWSASHCFPFPNSFYGLFTRWIGEINPNDLGTVPSDLPG